jgi:hypothetical protein
LILLAHGAGVPYRDSALLLNHLTILASSRASLEATYSQVLNDLEIAETSLPATTNRTGLHKKLYGRLNQDIIYTKRIGLTPKYMRQE